MPPYEDWTSVPVLSASVPLTNVCTAKPMVGKPENVDETATPAVGFVASQLTPLVATLMAVAAKVRLAQPFVKPVLTV